MHKIVRLLVKHSGTIVIVFLITTASFLQKGFAVSTWFTRLEETSACIETNQLEGKIYETEIKAIHFPSEFHCYKFTHYCNLSNVSGSSSFRNHILAKIPYEILQAGSIYCNL